MADLIGIEVSNEIYGLQDETARAAADSAESKAENAATSVETLAENLETDITAVLKKYLPTETVLWTNPNPSANFTEQNTEIPSMSQYDSIKILFANTNSQTNPLEAREYVLNTGTGAWYSITNTNDFEPTFNGYLWSRPFYINTLNNRIEWKTCIEWDISAIPSGVMDTADFVWIPIKIIGIKKGEPLPA